MNHARELVDAYVAIWNQADRARRHTAVAELWTEDAVHTLQPPQEIQEAARTLEVTPTFQARGHAELEARVTRAYEQFVASGEYSFRSRDNAARVGDAIKFNWEMVNATGQAAGVGLEFVLLDADGRVRLDYQFIELNTTHPSARRDRGPRNGRAAG